MAQKEQPKEKALSEKDAESTVRTLKDRSVSSAEKVEPRSAIGSGTRSYILKK